MCGGEVNPQRGDIVHKEAMVLGAGMCEYTTVVLCGMVGVGWVTALCVDWVASYKIESFSFF